MDFNYSFYKTPVINVFQKSHLYSHWALLFFSPDKFVTSLSLPLTPELFDSNSFRYPDSTFSDRFDSEPRQSTNVTRTQKCVSTAVVANGLVHRGTAVRAGNAIARMHDASGESPQPAADARQSAGDILPFMHLLFVLGSWIG
jgi:hypothetical protein